MQLSDEKGFLLFDWVHTHKFSNPHVHKPLVIHMHLCTFYSYTNFEKSWSELNKKRKTKNCYWKRLPLSYSSEYLQCEICAEDIHENISVTHLYCCRFCHLEMCIFSWSPRGWCHTGIHIYLHANQPHSNSFHSNTFHGLNPKQILYGKKKTNFKRPLTI